MKTNLSAYQSRVLWAIWIANSTLVEMTGISKGHISRTIKELKMRNIVTNSGNKLAFNKDYQQWRELPYRVRGYPIGQKVTPSGKKVTPSGGVKRNSSKETLQKKLYIVLSQRLGELILKRKPDFKVILKQKKKGWIDWANDIRLMVEIDNRDPKQIKEVIDWCQEDNFWQNNILSITKLRKQFDKLELKSKEIKEESKWL